MHVDLRSATSGPWRRELYEPFSSIIHETNSRIGIRVPDGIEVFLAGGGITNLNQERLTLIRRNFRPVWPLYGVITIRQSRHFNFSVVWWIMGHVLQHAVNEVTGAVQIREDGASGYPSLVICREAESSETGTTLFLYCGIIWLLEKVCMCLTIQRKFSDKTLTDRREQSHFGIIILQVNLAVVISNLNGQDFLGP